MDSMESFYTRERAGEGIQVPLYLPTGQKTEHWLRIRGVDSDHFRTAEADSRRQAIDIASISDKVEQAKAIAEAKLDLVCELVVSWSFDKECSKDNVKEFLKQAPQIADMVDQVASRRALFFAQRSSSSESLLSASSDSTEDQEDQSKL